MKYFVLCYDFKSIFDEEEIKLSISGQEIENKRFNESLKKLL